jgi:hypothetical protein
MFHPNRRLSGDSINTVQDFIPILGLPSHQIAAAAHPENRTKRLAGRRKPSRQALERRANDQLQPKSEEG